MEFFLQILVNGISLGFLYALSALGFVMIFKSSSVLNLAHGELLAIGAFVFLVLSTWANLPITLAFAFTLVGTFALGFVVERFFLRPLIGEELIHVIMLTLGIGIMFKGLLLFIFGGDIHEYRAFLPEALSIKWGMIRIPSVNVATFIIGILFLIIFGFFFKYSSQGIYMRSVADNQTAAQSLGVHVRRVFALSWAIAFIVAAMSGIVLGIINGINVHELSAIGLKVFPVVILGGLDSIGGAILGGLIIGLIETFTGGYVSTSLREIVPFIVLIVILMVKPYGLFGLVEIERV
ncbi:MAG: branched-chain amino acid ABC transporter permease [Deltaproteobacteria bacterium]|nr:branched-chain amino acid ABC transporter permease [Deltaproteobacteria bacterium]MBW2138541.1 branched-chain amino acid ABC transporter permease [Deltaproteobacteria bacterium]